MKKEEFLSEIRESGLLDEKLEKKLRTFSKMQSLAMDTLREFHRVCEKNGIRYQLAYGSLLGAIRDGGQIPWDYDVDVFVPYNEKEKLIEALKKDLGADFYFYCPEVDNKCRHFFMRLAPNGYKSEIIHVDVFYVIGVNTDDVQQLSKRMVKLFDYRFYNLVRLNEYLKTKTFLGKCKETLRFVLCRLFINEKKIEKEFERICNQYDFEKEPYSVSADACCGNGIYNTKSMWDTFIISTDEGDFRVSKDYENLLIDEYGDYNKIFPLKDRLNELSECTDTFERTV